MNDTYAYHYWKGLCLGVYATPGLFSFGINVSLSPRYIDLFFLKWEISLTSAERGHELEEACEYASKGVEPCPS
jgi:hypothetical protein